ncbi:MAG: hypothetical protein AABO57_12210 [Acidobacteriota bacterium]
MYRDAKRIAHLIFITMFLATSVGAQSFRPVLGVKADPRSGRAEAISLPPDPRCTDNCADPAIPAGVKQLIIDASNMTTQGDLTYKKSDRVTVVLKNKNPYRYKYKIDTTETTIQETAISAFLALLGSFVGDAATPAKPPAPPPAVGTAAPSLTRTADDECRDQLNAIIKTIDLEAVKAKDALNAAKAELARLKAKHELVRTVYTATRATLYLSAGLRCDELCSASYGFLDSLRDTVTPAEIKSLQDQIDALTGHATVVDTLAKDAIKRYARCAKPDQVDFLTTMIVFAAGIRTGAGVLQTDVNTIKEDITKFGDLKKAIDNVRGNKSSFVEVVEIGPFTRTTEVKIDVTTKEISSVDGKPGEEKAGPSKSVKIKFGDAPFFSLSGGIVFARLVKQEFIRVQGIQLDSSGNQVIVDGKPVVTTVVEAKEQSPTRILPLLQLNGRLMRWGGFIDGLHLSLGVTAKNDNKGTDVEYLVGPSFSMADEQLFLTIGGYAGRKQQLLGNLFQGARVPEGTAELPVQKNYKWTVGISLTYKIK